MTPSFQNVYNFFTHPKSANCHRTTDKTSVARGTSWGGQKYTPKAAAMWTATKKILLLHHILGEAGTGVVGVPMSAVYWLSPKSTRRARWEREVRGIQKISSLPQSDYRNMMIVDHYNVVWFSVYQDLKKHVTARAGKSNSFDVEYAMCCHIPVKFNVFLMVLLLCDYHKWTRDYGRILAWFFQCKPTAPTCNLHYTVMAIVWPYVLSGIQSEAPNDSPDVYDIISVFSGRENGQSGTPFERLGHLESLN